MTKSKLELTIDSNLKYNPDESYHHIKEKIPLTEDVFIEWMNSNANPKVLIEKIFFDFMFRNRTI